MSTYAGFFLNNYAVLFTLLDFFLGCGYFSQHCPGVGSQRRHYFLVLQRSSVKINAGAAGYIKVTLSGCFSTLVAGIDQQLLAEITVTPLWVFNTGGRSSYGDPS